MGQFSGHQIGHSDLIRVVSTASDPHVHSTPGTIKKPQTPLSAKQPARRPVAETQAGSEMGCSVVFFLLVALGGRSGEKRLRTTDFLGT